MKMKFNILNHYKRFDCHGNGCIIKGRVRVGKTTLVSIFTKQFLENGFAVISNVRFDDSVFSSYPNHLFYITSDYEFFESYIKIADNTPIILVWDDAQASDGMKSTQTISKSGEMLSKLLIFLGKFECNYLYIAHQKYIPNVILEGFEPLIIYKMQRNSFYVGNQIYETDFEIRQNCVYIPLPDINKIALPIKTKTPAYFEFKVDLPELYRYLSKYTVNDDLRGATREFLKTNKNDSIDNHLKKLTWVEIVKAIYYKRNGKLTGKEKIYQIINSRVLYQTLDELNRIEKPFSRDIDDTPPK